MLSSLLPSSSESEEESLPPSSSDVDVVKKEKEPKYEEIRQRMQERLTVLSRQRKELASKNEAKRIQALRKQATRAVQKAFTDDELKEIGLPTNLKLGRKRGQVPSDSCEGELGETSGGQSKTQSDFKTRLEYREKWSELRAYLDPNPQLRGTDPGQHRERSGLEKALDKAVEDGNLEEAISISDQLAGREFAVKIATAFDCLEYVDRLKKEEERKKRKKPKLKWTFEAKQNWEMKSNM